MSRAWAHCSGVLGIAVTLVADAVLFFFVLVRMPDADVTLRIGIRGALLAAVGFELLKIIGTYTVAASASSATAGPFAEPARGAGVDPAGEPLDAVQCRLDGRGHARRTRCRRRPCRCVATTRQRPWTRQAPRSRRRPSGQR